MRAFRGSAAIALVCLLVTLAATGSGAAADKTPAERPVTAAAAKAGEPIDLNRAGVAELETVPGIGPVTAQRIVDFREENGPFERVEDLLKIKGIGEKSFEKLRPYLKVGKTS
jgi:competence protein ComEA